MKDLAFRSEAFQKGLYTGTSRRSPGLRRARDAAQSSRYSLRGSGSASSSKNTSPAESSWLSPVTSEFGAGIWIWVDGTQGGLEDSGSADPTLVTEVTLSFRHCLSRCLMDETVSLCRSCGTSDGLSTVRKALSGVSVEEWFSRAACFGTC